MTMYMRKAKSWGKKRQCIVCPLQCDPDVPGSNTYKRFLPYILYPIYMNHIYKILILNIHFISISICGVWMTSFEV